MSLTLVPPIAEALSIAGPAGTLEALLESPAAATTQPTRVAVICHPHPLYGGTMTNKVVHMLAKSFNELGVPAVRFNYRGVGASTGQYAEGDGETDDTIAVIDWVKSRWPDAQLWLGGFSFGGAVAIRAAVQRDTQLLVTVAPAIRRVVVDTARLPTCPWLLVQGDNDELVDAADIQRWMQTLPNPPELALLAGVDHFFHGRVTEMRSVVMKWAQQFV
jgi:alpha/beta superfamily hydrolase